MVYCHRVPVKAASMHWRPVQATRAKADPEDDALTDFTSTWLVYFRLQNATAGVVGLGHTADVLCAYAERVPEPVDGVHSVSE